jgi:hypothetical protein
VPAPPSAGLLGQVLRPAATLPAWQSRRPDAWAAALAGLQTQAAPDAEMSSLRRTRERGSVEFCRE